MPGSKMEVSCARIRRCCPSFVWTSGREAHGVFLRAACAAGVLVPWRADSERRGCIFGGRARITRLNAGVPQQCAAVADRLEQWRKFLVGCH
jgi:hypothetical protein